MDYEQPVNRDEEMNQTEANVERDHQELQNALADYINGEITAEQYKEMVTNIIARNEQV
jgi:hypothetical protein